MSQNSKNSRVERNARVFHVCQRLVPGIRIFNRPNIFELYMSKIQKAFADYGCGNLLYLVMPNHPHLIVVTIGYTEMSRAMQSANSAFAREAVKEKDSHGNLLVTGHRVFRERPAYVPVFGFSQLLDECWYVVHNADDLQKKRGRGEKPYFAGSMFRFAFGTSGYDDNHPLMRMLKTDVDEFTKLISLGKEEFQKAKKEFLKRFTKKYEDRCFKIDPSKPFTTQESETDSKKDPFSFLQ